MLKINWRKPVIYLLFYLTGSNIPKYIREIESADKLKGKEAREFQEDKLKKILTHAYKNVPYYNKILKEAGVIDDQEKVKLNNFNRIPLLTKKIIRKEGQNLYSRDYKKRKPYKNTSGGSTGEPVLILQDKNYHEWNVATKIFYAQKVGKEIGDSELKIWGSLSDIDKETKDLTEKLKNWLYNRKVLNTFILDKKTIQHCINTLNKSKPKHIWAYTDSIYELAKYARKKNIQLHSPNSIIVTATILDEPIRNFLEESFGTRVFNQYGSREVGDITSENLESDFLDVFLWSQYVEQQTNLALITNLNNYTMPLIRYEIGDSLELKNQLQIKKILGRLSDYFIKKDGSKVHGGYFRQLLYFQPWLKKFKIIQEDYSHIVCHFVVAKIPDRKELEKIKFQILDVMGKNCKIEFNFVDKIKSSNSGKYLYTVSKIKLII